MNTKTLIAAGLLLFVAISVFTLIKGESGRAVQANAEAPAPANEAESNTHLPERQVSAIYFMTDVRCPSCVKIETWSHQAILDGFEDELERGVLKWEMINYEDPENAHYVKDYGLITKSVVLVEHIDGKEARHYNLPEVWNLLGDQEKFTAYINDEVRLFISPNHNKGYGGENT